MQPLSGVERMAIKNALENPDFKSGLQKFLASQQQRFTVKCRDKQNEIPETLDAEMQNSRYAMQYAAMAKAYGAMFGELDKVSSAGTNPDTDE